MSPPLPDLEPLAGLDDAALGRFRAALDRAGFNADLVGEVEGIAPGQLDQVRLPVVHWWLRRRATPAVTLARLFAYNDTVTRSELDEALPEELIEALVGAGLIEASPEGRLGSRARIMPFEGLWLASDEMDAPGDPVMGPGATTGRLVRAMGQPSGESVLDVGCGAGTLALVAAARGAREAVGLDIMERAVAWSRFNARLNGLEATFLAGDLTAPVAGRRFDLVVSQPPFVIQPPSAEATTYLHGGPTGDEIALRLLAEVPEVLGPGGRALLLFDAPELPDRPVEQGLREALDGSGLRAFAVTSPGHSADLSAIAYSTVRHPALDEAYRAAVRDGREHLAALGIEGSAHVLLLACRPRAGESPMTVVLDTDSPGRWDAEALAALRAGTALASSDDGRLMESEVRLSPRAWLVGEQPLERGKGHRLRVRFEGSRTPDLEISDAAAVLIEAARGGGTVRDLVRRYARSAGAKPAVVRAQVLGFVRQALVSGLLVAG